MSRVGRILLGTAVVAVLLAAFAVAGRVVSAPVDTLGPAAAADARESARVLGAALTRALDERDGAPGPELASAFDDVLAATDPLVAYEPVDAGGADGAWRVQLAGGASASSGFLARNARALVCFDVTVDRGADPPVRMRDSDCLSAPRPDEPVVPVHRPG